MSKMYPNGGYRNKSAKELSMPSLADPPPVMGNTVSEPRNMVNNLRVGGDLRGKMTPGLSTARGGGTNITIDLRPFADGHANSLSNAQRDNMTKGNYGTGTKTINIDLKGSDYRVDGRGAIARAALKLARQVVGVGRRLPKNLYKELVLYILDQLLNQLSKVILPQTLEQGLTVTAPVRPDNGWGGVWAMDPTLASFVGGTSIEIPGAVSIRQTGGAVTLGEVISSMDSTIPTNTIANRNTWLAAGKTPYYVSRNEVNTAATPMQNLGNLTYTYHNIIVGESLPGLFNSRLIATLQMPRSQPAATVQAYRRVRPLVLGAAFPYGEVTGGDSDPTKTKVIVREPFPDKKYGAPWWLQQAAAGAFAATEFGDLIDSIYDALPSNRQYGRSYLDKLDRISRYWHEINWGKAIGNIILNQIEDRVVGKILGVAGDQLRSTDIGGTNYKYGVTSGGGSTIYTGDIAF